ncbi:MAG: hypothetical protein CW742_05110 [Methanoregula sp.]|nr:MAG: hypothetical protein CW742_05110 [Methanoregula sp.]
MLLAELTARYAGPDEMIFSSPGTIRGLVTILKNGRKIHFLAGLDTPLAAATLLPRSIRQPVTDNLF